LNLKNRDLKSESISSEGEQRSIFQRWVFDSYKYQSYFDTTTAEIQEKLADALWPFFPEYQYHLAHEDSESQQVKQFIKRPNIELYGPIWIFITLIIEICILGHLQQAIRLEFGSQLEQSAPNSHYYS